MGHVLYFHKKNLITNKVLLKVWHHSLNHKSWKNDAFIFYPITCITIYMIKIACIFHWIKERALSSKLHVNVFHSYTYILEFRLSCDTNFYQKIYIANYLCWAPIISFDSSLKIPQTSQHFIGMRFLQINLWWARQVWKVYTYL